MDDVTEEISKARYIATEPISFLILANQGMLSTLRLLYIQETLAREYQYNLLPQQGGNCSLRNVSDPLEAKINSETALWVMWSSSVSTFLPILTASVLAASSDFIGRKPILVFSAIGHLIVSLIFLLVSAFRLPLAVTLLASIILGICGDTTATSTVCSAYIADSTTGHSRTQRLVLQTLAMYAGWGCGQALGGVLLQYLDNFLICFTVPVALSVISLAYTACPGILLETISIRVNISAKKVLHNSFENLRGIFRNGRSDRKWMVWCLMAVVCFNLLVNHGLYDVIVIYGLGRPFCWTPDIIGYYSAAVTLFPAGVAALIVGPLLKCFSEYWLIQFALISFIAQIVTSALAENTVQLAIVATVVGLMRTTTGPLCRDLISKAVTKIEHGMVFALLSLAMSVMSVCSPFFINGLFAYTITIGFPQLTLYVTSIVLLIPISLTGILQYYQRPSRDKETPSSKHDQLEGSRTRSEYQCLSFSEDETEMSPLSNSKQR